MGSGNPLQNMKDARKKALEDFLNDPVEEIGGSFFKWRNRMYQVLPYKQIREWGSREDQFVKHTFKYEYGIREITPVMFKRVTDRLAKLDLDK